MPSKVSISRSLLTLGLTATLLSGCGTQSVMREDAVKRTAMPVFMLERTIPGTDFMFAARERVYKKYQPATIYIEGDGRSWIDRDTISSNPTPTVPFALNSQIYWASKKIRVSRRNTCRKDTLVLRLSH